MTTKKANKQNISYHHGDLHDALIAAAITLIKEKGPNAFSMREVAKKAGVSHNAPYRHFADRAALLHAIARLGFQALTARLAEAIAEHPEAPRRQLLDAGIAYVELAVENPEITQIMFGGFIDPETCLETLPGDDVNAFSGLIEIIENGVSKGHFRQDDPQNLALAAWSMVHGLAMLITSGQIPAMENSQQVREIALMVKTCLLEGILATPTEQ